MALNLAWIIGGFVVLFVIFLILLYQANKDTDEDVSLGRKLWKKIKECCYGI